MKKIVPILLVLATLAGIATANLGERHIYDRAGANFKLLASRDPNNWWDDVNDVYTMNGLLDVVDVNATGTFDVNDVNVTGDFFLSGFTEGSVLFIGVDSNVAEDNTNFTWTDATDTLDVNGMTISGTRPIGLDLSSGTFATASIKLPAGTIQSTGDLVFQPTVDSTTAWQWLDADGGTPVLNIDTTNERVGIGIVSPETDFHIKNSAGIAQLLLQSLATSDATIRIRNGSSSKWTFGNDASNDEFIISTGSILGTPKLTILQNGKTGIGTGANAPNAPLEVKGAKPAGNVGGFQSGMLHVTGSGTAEFSNSVITGHSAYNTNTQLWYLGSTSSSNKDIAFINRQNAPMHFYTNNTSRMTIESNGDMSLFNGAERRYYDVGNSNYVGFEAPALTANQIWILPIADGDAGSVLTTDGFGSLDWEDNASEKSWAFMSRDASSGTNYIGGFYKFETSDNDFNPSVTFGTVNSSYAAHFFLVQAAGASGGVDTVVRVTGTTMDDQGNRATGVNVDITVDDAGAVGTYYETPEKWLGQVTLAKQSGPDLLMNYGFCKYWDNNNTHFKVSGMEATWLGAKNDNTPDILLRHHKAIGWTYNNAAAPTPPPPIASMATDHNTEIFIVNNEEGAWKRDDLTDNVHGEITEGLIIELQTTTNRTYAIGNFMVRITPFGDIDMIYENGDQMIYENGDQMIYN